MEVNQIQAALLTLSSNHRAVIELIALGYSVSEIASIVECPENTVKTTHTDACFYVSKGSG